MSKAFHIDGREHRYRVGSTFVCIRSTETGEKTIIGLDKVLGMDWYDIERSEHKKGRDHNVTPSRVKAAFKAEAAK